MIYFNHNEENLYRTYFLIKKLNNNNKETKTENYLSFEIYI